MKCPNLQFFEEYLSDELNSKERLKFERHLQSCTSCAQILEREKNLDDILRSQTLIKAPAGFKARILANIPPVITANMLPDWLQAIALGLFITFIGFMVGKFGVPRLEGLLTKISGLNIDLQVINNLEKYGISLQGAWPAQISGSNFLLVVNFLIAGIIFCWALWQMVKALRG